MAKAIKYVLSVQLLVIFCLGGVVQLVGLLTNTQTTLAVSSLSAACIIANCLFTERLGNLAPLRWALLATMVIVASSLWGGTDAGYVIGALAVWVFVPASTVSFLRLATHHVSRRAVYRAVLIIGLCQLPVMMAQRLLADNVQRISGGTVDEIDVAFGTFFLKSDHAVSFLMVSFVIYLLYGGSTDHGLRSRIFLISWFCATAAYSHSTISHLLVAVVLVSYPLVRLIASVNKFGRAASFSLVVGVVAVSLTFLWQILSQDLSLLYRDSGIANASGGEDVARYSMLLKFINEPIRYLGDGAFSYYNPVTKGWFVYGGHSQWYSVYFDFGILGCGAFLAFLYMLARVRTAARADWCIYVGAFLMYGFVALTFQDLAMLFVLFFFTSWPAATLVVPKVRLAIPTHRDLSDARGGALIV